MPKKSYFFLYYADWLLAFYNHYRPNIAIDGQVPEEKYRGMVRPPPDKNAKQLKYNIRKISFADGVLNAFVSESKTSRRDRVA